jgi:HK97 family phage prohead protease
MSATFEETKAFAEHMVEQQTQQAFVRTFEAELAPGDGRTLEARIAPYNTPARVADPPDFTPYQEVFAPGAFERQLSAPDRVRIWLNFEHEQGLRGIVGHGLQLHDRSDGLHGDFRVMENADGDKALQLVHEGLLTGLSVEFAALRSRTIDGVVHRLRAHISAVSLCRFPAYQGAEVLAVREEPTVTRPALVVPVLDPDLTERLGRLGVTPLQRMSVTSRPWNGSPGRFTDEQYLASCLIVRPGDGPAKERGSLPVLEPNGDLNTNALGAAAAALAGARGGVRNVTAAQKQAAARKLIRYYGTAGMEPPASLRATAGVARTAGYQPAPTRARMDAEDLSTVAQMLELGTAYIDDQDEPGDQKNIPVMEQALALISSLVPVEVAETEPDEPEDEE